MGGDPSNNRLDKKFGIFPKTRLCVSVGPPEQGIEEGASVAPLVLAVCSIFIILTPGIRGVLN